MKKALLIFAFLFTAAFLSAQGAEADGAGSGAGAAVSLEVVCKSLAERPNTTGDFTQIKTINANGRQLKSNGKFIISTEGIMWKTEKPFPSTLILTESAMVQIAANGNKSVMSGKDNQIFTNISETLRSVFSGNVSALKKNFNCQFLQDKGTWKILLEPRDSTIASVMTSLELGGRQNGGAAALDYLELNETSSNKTRYEFSNQSYPKELSADEKQNFVIE